MVSVVDENLYSVRYCVVVVFGLPMVELFHGHLETWNVSRPLVYCALFVWFFVADFLVPARVLIHGRISCFSVCPSFMGGV